MRDDSRKASAMSSACSPGECPLHPTCINAGKRKIKGSCGDQEAGGGTGRIRRGAFHSRLTSIWSRKDQEHRISYSTCSRSSEAATTTTTGKRAPGGQPGLRLLPAAGQQPPPPDAIRSTTNTDVVTSATETIQPSTRHDVSHGGIAYIGNLKNNTAETDRHGILVPWYLIRKKSQKKWR